MRSAETLTAKFAPKKKSQLDSIRHFAPRRLATAVIHRDPRLPKAGGGDAAPRSRFRTPCPTIFPLTCLENSDGEDSVCALPRSGWRLPEHLRPGRNPPTGQLPRRPDTAVAAGDQLHPRCTTRLDVG